MPDSSAPGGAPTGAPPRVLKPPRTLPDEGILVGYSLEHEHRTAPIGFRYAARPSVGVDREEYLEPILHTGSGHLMTVAPTGAGKGVSCIIPTLLRFPGPIIVVDPKGENYAVTAARRRALGHEVILLDPMGITGVEESSALNPLDLVDPQWAVAIDDAAMLASLLTAGLDKADPRNLFWYQRGEQLATGLIQHIAVSSDPEDRNLTELRRLLNLPAEDFMQMVTNQMAESPDANVRSVAGMLTNPAIEMVGSILGMAQNSLEFLRGDLVQSSTDRSSFDLEAVTRGDSLSIYLVIPPDKLESHRNLLRLWIGCLLAALMRRRASPPHRTLLILDEASQLGSLDQLRQSVTLMRGYGLQTWSFWQDLSQLMNLYPADWQTMYNNCQVHQSFGFTNLHAARGAAELAGFYDPLEVLGLDADEMILSIAGDEAVIARKPNYLTDPAFHGLFSANPFYRAAADAVPTPRRPQRRYVRPSRAQAAAPVLDPATAQVPAPGSGAGPPTPQPPPREAVPGQDGAPDATRAADAAPAPDAASAPATDAPRAPKEPADPGAFSARTSVVLRGPAEIDELPDGIALEGYGGVQVVPPSETPSLLRAVARVAPDGDWNPYRVVARRAPLSFYPGYELFEVADPERHPPREFIIRAGGDAVRLDWTNRAFYDLNARVPLVLTDENVSEYVKIFFRFVRGRHGHFLVMETPEDVPLPWTTEPGARAALDRYVQPLRLRETRDDGTRVLEACFLFKDSLFSATALVGPDGLVTLEDEELAVESVSQLVAAGGAPDGADAEEGA